MAKFVLTTWAACFARQKPVSTSAKPACMKITSTAPMMTQRLLSPRSVWLMPLIGLMSIDGSTAKAATFVTSTSAAAIVGDDRRSGVSSVSHGPPEERLMVTGRQAPLPALPRLREP